MKTLSLFVLLSSLIAFVYCGGSKNYEITYYGNKGDEGAAEDPSCDGFDHGLPTYFAALSTKLDGYDDYCGKYVVFMKADGSSSNIARATVVDSCSSCGKYHLDLSLPAFEKVGKKGDGVGKAIWGVYSKSGEKLAGPFYDSVSGAASKFGVSSDQFVTTTVVATTSNLPAVTTTKAIGATTTGTVKLMAATASVANLASQSITPKQTSEVKPVDIAIDEGNDDGLNVTIGVIAIGGGIGAAAGVGLLMMKKKSPATYESMKQKFPEAFSNVKRGLTRKATSLKRRVTKAPKPSLAAAAV
eukprot:jgi/Orpsp1_1/1177795/evm.model.c7180000062872.1